MILAIETSTPVCSVALLASDGVIYEKRESGKGIHSEKLFLFIESLLSDHSSDIGQIDELLLSGGPGSYTGLRIGAAAVKGLLFGKKTTLRLIGSLEAMVAGIVTADAADSPNMGTGTDNKTGTTAGLKIAAIAGRKSDEPVTVHCVIDARRQHLYYQQFTITGDKISWTDPATTPLKVVNGMVEQGDFVIGTGLERLALDQVRESRAGRIVGETAISAVNLIRARNHPLFRGWFREADPAVFEPEYLSMGQVNQ